MAKYDFDDLRDEDEDQPQRFVSIDALRGFDMFWILGASELARSLPVSGGKLAVAVPAEEVGDLKGVDRVIHFVADQLEHVDWAGFHFYDLIFPLFVFLMGVSTVFSLNRIVSQQGKAKAYWRVIRRAALLYALGIFYHGGMGSPEQFRLVGVLHRIAICYLVGGILFLNFRWRGLVVISALLLIGYWALLTFVHVPGHGAGNFNEGTNLANYIDANYLPGHKWRGDWDPEGLLSTMPAIVSGLLGIFAGLLLQNRDISSGSRIAWLLLIGVACIAAGYGWHNAPVLGCLVIKNLWTPSFVLYTGGWGFVLVALFHLIIDVAKFDFWARPFVWIGMNPITLYMLKNMVGGYSSLVKRVFHDHWIAGMAPWGGFGVAVLGTLIPVWLAWEMYRRKIFIRV